MKLVQRKKSMFAELTVKKNEGEIRLKLAKSTKKAEINRKKFKEAQKRSN